MFCSITVTISEPFISQLIFKAVRLFLIDLKNKLFFDWKLINDITSQKKNKFFRFFVQLFEKPVLIAFLTLRCCKWQFGKSNISASDEENQLWTESEIHNYI
jgi:hypothetical protein